MALPKLIFTDIDGVWTDGGMYYDESTNNEFKKFCTSDSAGVIFARLLNIPVVIITGEDTNIVARRAKKLQISEVHLGVKNKVEKAKEICAKYAVGLEDVAFIGDDINDLALLKLVGFTGAPCTARSYIQREVDYVTELKGGEGAFREFVERILTENDMLEEVLSRYLNQ